MEPRLSIKTANGNEVNVPINKLVLERNIEVKNNKAETHCYACIIGGLSWEIDEIEHNSLIEGLKRFYFTYISK